MMAEATLFVVDDDLAVRDSVSKLLAGSEFGIETFASTQKFLNQFDPNRPGCLLIDIQVPGIEGLDLTKRLKDQKTRYSTIIIMSFAQVSLPAAVMKAGATDLIEKPFQKEDLLPRVQAAMQLDAETRRHQTRQIEFGNLLHTLTNREREVFEHVVQGKSTKVIATELGSSYHTVRNQRSSILRKLKADTVVDAVRKVSEYRSLLESFHQLVDLKED